MFIIWRGTNINCWGHVMVLNKINTCAVHFFVDPNNASCPWPIFTNISQWFPATITVWFRHLSFFLFLKKKVVKSNINRIFLLKPNLFIEWGPHNMDPNNLFKPLPMEWCAPSNWVQLKQDLPLDFTHGKWTITYE